jgi:hypothetical protein
VTAGGRGGRENTFTSFPVCGEINGRKRWGGGGRGEGRKEVRERAAGKEVTQRREMTSQEAEEGKEDEGVKGGEGIGKTEEYN